MKKKYKVGNLINMPQQAGFGPHASGIGIISNISEGSAYLPTAYHVHFVKANMKVKFNSMEIIAASVLAEGRTQ